MKLAILTDIHANREAFEAVLSDSRAHGAEQLVLLGDIVGYGPDPDWCADKAAALVGEGAICIRGNHDSAAGGARESMSALARRAMEWTVKKLSDGQRRFLADLPLMATMDDILFVHASANEPAEWSYVTSDSKATASFRASPARVILCGHVHVPLLVSSDLTGVVREQGFRIGLPIPLLRSRRWLAVVGSVGQPRDRSPQAAWALLDTALNQMTFRRVPYDVATTAAKIRAAGLPEELALRLTEGK